MSRLLGLSPWVWLTCAGLAGGCLLAEFLQKGF